MGTARYGTIPGYDGTYKVNSSNKVAADLAVLDADGKEALVLSFRSSNRLSGEMYASLKGADGTIIAELQREALAQ